VNGNTSVATPWCRSEYLVWGRQGWSSSILERKLTAHVIVVPYELYELYDWGKVPELYGTLRILRFILENMSALYSLACSTQHWVRQCTVVVVGHIRTFVSLIEFVLFVTQRIQCNGLTTLLKRLIRSLTTSDSEWLARNDSSCWRLGRIPFVQTIVASKRGVKGKGRGRSGPRKNLVRGVEGLSVPVKYPQAPLIKQVLYL